MALRREALGYRLITRYTCFGFGRQIVVAQIKVKCPAYTNSDGVRSYERWVNATAVEASFNQHWVWMQ